MAVRKMTEQSMAEIRSTDCPALIEFSANWCGYCRRIEPALKRLSEKYEGQVTFGCVDIDADPALADRFRVDTVPSLFAYANARWSEALVAPSSGAEIEAFLRACIEVNV